MMRKHYAAYMIKKDRYNVDKKVIFFKLTDVIYIFFNHKTRNHIRKAYLIYVLVYTLLNLINKKFSVRMTWFEAT